jgi:hypothetical protein
MSPAMHAPSQQTHEPQNRVQAQLMATSPTPAAMGAGMDAYLRQRIEQQQQQQLQEGKTRPVGEQGFQPTQRTPYASLTRAASSSTNGAAPRTPLPDLPVQCRWGDSRGTEQQQRGVQEGGRLRRTAPRKHRQQRGLARGSVSSALLKNRAQHGQAVVQGSASAAPLLTFTRPPPVFKGPDARAAEAARAQAQAARQSRVRSAGIRRGTESLPSPSASAVVASRRPASGAEWRRK